MNSDKNAALIFSFYPDDYPGISLTFNCNEDLSMSELVDFFKRFAIAMSFSPQTVENYLGED